MSLLSRLALLFVLVPVLELMLLVKIGEMVGFLPTLALVILTGVTGAAFARAEGIRVFFQFQKELASGRLPGQALLDGASVLLGGAFLLTPGILTDLLGFTLLLPPTRRWIQKRVRKSLERRVRDGSLRVMTMGPGGFGGSSGTQQPPGSGQGGSAGSGLDPDKEIRVEGPDR